MSGVQHPLSDASCEVRWGDISSDPPLSHSASRSGATPTKSHSRDPHGGIPQTLDVIRGELEQLKMRRKQLETQRKELLEVKRRACNEQRIRPASSSASGRTVGARSSSTPGLSTARARSEMDSHTASFVVHASHERQSNVTYPDSHMHVTVKSILSEDQRRRLLKATPHLLAKNALRNATQSDSTALMGGFLLEDNPRVCTFGRERRFRPLLGCKGRYYLGTEVAPVDYTNRSYGVGGYARDGLGYTSSTPGPGAYTPRYIKLSRPPRTY